LRCLQFESHKKGSKVLRYGEFGDRFYIIFSGRAEVQIPLEEINQENSAVDLDSSDILQLSE